MQIQTRFPLLLEVPQDPFETGDPEFDDYPDGRPADLFQATYAVGKTIEQDVAGSWEILADRSLHEHSPSAAGNGRRAHLYDERDGTRCLKVGDRTISLEGLKEAVLSPAGDRLAMVRQLPGEARSLWMARPDGSELTRSSAPEDPFGLRFSADGHRLYFQDDHGIVRFDLDSGTSTSLLRDASVPFAVAPDEKWLVIGGETLTRVDLSNGKKRTLRKSEDEEDGWGIPYYTPAISPDGSRIFFVYSRLDFEGNTAYRSSYLGVMGARGGTVRALEEHANDVITGPLFEA